MHQLSKSHECLWVGKRHIAYERSLEDIDQAFKKLSLTSDGNLRNVPIKRLVLQDNT